MKKHFFFHLQDPGVYRILDNLFFLVAFQSLSMVQPYGFVFECLFSACGTAKKGIPFPNRVVLVIWLW